MLTTTLEQPAYPALMTRFLGEPVIGISSNEFLKFPRIVRRPVRIAARIGNRHHYPRPLIRGEILQRMERVRGPSVSSGRGATEREFGYSVRMPQHQFERDHAAERYANDPNALPSDCVQQGCGVVCIVSHRRPCLASTYARARVGRMQARQRFSPMAIPKGWAS